MRPDQTNTTSPAETRRPAAPAPGNPDALDSSRVDAAHDSRLASRLNLPDSILEDEPAPWTEDAFVHPGLEKQAAELAERLRDVQNRLDQRESALNSRQAQLDSDVRRVRLQENERQVELDELKSTRTRLLNELADRSQALAAAEHSACQDLEQTNLDQRNEQDRLDREQQSLQTERRRLQKQAELIHHSQQGLDQARCSNETHWLKLKQEMQLESVAAQMQHSRLVQQAERAAEQVHDKQRILDQRVKETIRQEDELRRRDEHLAAQETQFSVRERRIEETRKETQRTRVETDDLASGLRKRAGDLRLERERLNQQVEQLGQRESDVQMQTRDLAEERENWAAVADDLDQHREYIAKELHDHESDLGSAWSKLRSKLNNLRHEQQQWQEERKRTRLEFVRREKALNERQQALERLRCELRQLHQETLEMRLAAEELAAELRCDASTLRLNELIPRIRQKIADHFQEDRDALSAQREGVVDLLQRLQTQRQDADRARKSVQQWFVRRQRQIEEDSARLIARQYELDSEAAQSEKRAQGWEQERLDLQQNARRLAKQVACADSGPDLV